MRTSFINFPPRHGIVVEMRYERKVHYDVFCLRSSSIFLVKYKNGRRREKKRERKKRRKKREKKGGGSNGSDYVKIHRQMKNDEQWFILSIYSNPLFPLMKREYFNVNLFISSTTPVAFFWGWIYVNMETRLKNIVVMIFDRLCLKYEFNLIVENK